MQSIERKMNNSYCYVLFERLSQSRKAKCTGTEIDRAVKNALRDYPQIRKHGIDEMYILCFDLLKTDGIGAAVSQWNRIRGIE